MEDKFSATQFFSKTNNFSSLFDGVENIWEVLPNIQSFIEDFKRNMPSGFHEIGENIFVGENVMIDKSAKIIGGAIIGSNSSIGHTAYLRGGVLIGENVNIGHAVEVKHSIIFDNAAVAHLNYIGDSIVGNGVNVGGGAVLANWRFDKKEIVIKNGEKIIDTGMDKLGSILGDGCGIGVNAVLNPGVILGQNSIVYPLVSVSGVYPPNSKIKE